LSEKGGTLINRRLLCSGIQTLQPLPAVFSHAGSLHRLEAATQWVLSVCNLSMRSSTPATKPCGNSNRETAEWCPMEFHVIPWSYP
jgi:hypothetical protein